MSEDIKQPAEPDSPEAQGASTLPTPPTQETVPLNAEGQAEAAPSPSDAPQPEGAEPKPESRFKRFLRRLLWTLAAIVVVFAAGFITAWVVLYRPLHLQKQNLAQQLQRAQEAQAALEVEKAALENKWQQAQTRIAELEKQKEQIAAERDRAQTLQYLFSALANTYAAQLALDQKNTTSARLYLSNVQAALRLLAERLPEQKEVFAEMNQRVDKALQTLSSSPLTAKGELAALADYLGQLENLLTQK